MIHWISKGRVCYEKDYDGTPLTSTEYVQVGELAFNDRFVNSSLASQSITEIGVIKIENEFGQDVTSQYKIDSSFGQLKINRIKIKLSSNDLNKVYNGKPFDTNEFSYKQEGKLLPGDKLIVTFDDAEKAVLSERQIDACLDVANAFQYKILDSKNVDVTDRYYDVSTEFGSINISRRPLDISYTNVKFYDRIKLSETYPIDDPANPIYTEITNDKSVSYSSLPCSPDFP